MSKPELIPCITIICILLGGGFIHGNDDPWLLFDHADHLIHGTVIQVVEGERDRLYQIATEQEASLDSGPASWWLREPEGAGVEGIGASIGTRGAWLVANVVGGEFPAADATVMPGGLLRVSSPQGAADLLLLKNQEVDSAIVLELIHSQDAVIRRIAIGWWRTSNTEPLAKQFAEISSAFGHESDPAVQRSWLETYLQRGWTFDGSGLADLIPFSTDAAVSMLTSEYIKDRGTLRQRARLVSAWPGADLEAKKRLAIAYRQLRISEASPWLLQGITSSEPSLRSVCIESLGAAAGNHLESTFSALLHSTSDETRACALRGLARNRTPGSWQLLIETIESMQPTDPLRPLAIALKKHPWKILQTKRRR
jgi:hypothetical protein